MGIITFLCLGYAIEYLEKLAVFDMAKAKSIELHKPLLNAGCGYYFRTAIENSDVNIDVVPRDVPHFIVASIENIPYPDKYFGAIFCSHVIEHVDDEQNALTELVRVSDYQYIITPRPIWLSNWLNPDHKRIYLSDKVFDKSNNKIMDSALAKLR